MLTAFGQGEDDYICKPFELSVLAAKIKAMLHRAYDFSAPPSVLEKGELCYDVQSYIVTYKEQSLTLSKNEGRILKILLENDTKIVSRNALMDDLWNTDCYVDENTLSVNINRLRKKLESIGIKDLIKTHKGQGYSL
jgi:DNA-binding response OmpR family regulator